MTIRILPLRFLGRAFVLGALPLLAACGNPLYGAQPTHAEIMADRIAVAQNPSAPPIYCYRSLADAYCRAKPEPGQEDRLMSYDGQNYSSPPR